LATTTYVEGVRFGGGASETNGLLKRGYPIGGPLRSLFFLALSRERPSLTRALRGAELPHQSLDNAPLKQPKRPGRPKQHFGPLDEQIVPLLEVRCKQRLGGLLKSYSRKAA